ncbi:cation diffusion facilitator family transporter [Dokdonia sp. Hel_I_53]|uniref:cation diffusion facilitator family transporter n=1 Tax=Dokdonia sp. Hel_I_53 TaxID=1566287 RepID=UPI00119A23EF|nr:cation diffusion facilitator family transporter [Dokdonia sp. Hel_I_53]TVZ52309.1 cobalt-zinc-cadmium efflux system protein [Dokdonia sp. Hel_I_53]
MSKGHSHHNHSHAHHHHTGNIKVAFFLNVIFTIIEIIGGIMTNSVAILSDAVHDLGDSLSLGLAWYFQNYSKKEATQKYSYGYRRFSLLGAIINSIVLVVGGVFIIIEAVPRLINPVTPDAKGMIILGILGVIFNGAAVLRLKKGTSINERVVSLHLLEDVLGWVAVLIGAVLMYFFDIPILDPILSLGIALYIVFNVYKNLKETIQIVMQGTPEGVAYDKVKIGLTEFKEIEAAHDLHIWSMDGEYTILTAHLVLNKNLSALEMATLKGNVRAYLKEHHIEHATLEFEFEGENCTMENRH